jgi:hypothetical protein
MKVSDSHEHHKQPLILDDLLEYHLHFQTACQYGYCQFLVHHMSKDGVIEIKHIDDEIFIITEPNVAVAVSSEVNGILAEYQPFDIHFKGLNIKANPNKFLRSTHWFD